MITQVIMCMLATAAFAILFHVPRTEYLCCALNGAVGWITYLAWTAHGAGPTSASIWASLALTLVARILSSIRKMPSTVFLITGIFSLVPGSGLYYTSYYLIMGDLARFMGKGTETLKIAGGIVLGMIFGLVFPQSWFNRLGKAAGRIRKRGGGGR
ncbi:MAG: threonine/serine exporter [Lachnospiraceae bacterium]|jgi:uncharacterized membrane protein YjjB (DUF3815 family)|nr:threonine/serine exporter [Lachnospiraceae bacterium]